MSQTEVPEVDLSEVEKTPIVRGLEGGSFICELPQFPSGGSIAQLMFSGGNVAVKQIDASIMDEAKSLFRLQHESLFKTHAIGVIGADRFLIMEKYPRTLGGEFTQARRRNPQAFLNPLVVADWIGQITSGMVYLHENDIAHGNLKPSNILIDWQNNARVADFALAGKQDARYVAPEVHNGKELNLDGRKKADAWSYGIVLWEMFSARLPFEAVAQADLAKLIGAGDVTSHPPIPVATKFTTLEVILLNCWFVDAKLRSSFSHYAKLAADLLKEITEETERADDKMTFWMDECKGWGAAK